MKLASIDLDGDAGVRCTSHRPDDAFDATLRQRITREHEREDVTDQKEA
jgi:hypothetical protein